MSMTNIRRYYRQGQIYFLTHVTDKRSPILVDNVELLWKAYAATIAVSGAETIAWAVMPDHFHLIIDPRDQNLSSITKRFKLKFSGLYRSRIRLARGRVWQNRFWDHIIRDQRDLNVHIDYVHYNPVKHGINSDPFLYQHSSLIDFLNRGLYSRDWGCHEQLVFEGDFGE